MPKYIRVNHWHEHLTYVTKKKNPNPTIKIALNYTPFILYTPGSVTEVANKPKPNARYGSKRKGSCSPTTERDAPQPSRWPLPAKNVQAEVWNKVRGTYGLPSPSGGEREDSKA